MQKKFVFTVFLYCYELFRLVFVLTYHPEFNIEMLPASWYLAVPLMTFPFIFLYLSSKKEYPAEIFYKLFALTKVLSAAGAVSFFRAAFPVYFTYGPLNNYYSLKSAFILMIFSVFDVILAVVFFVKKRSEHLSSEKLFAQNTSHTTDCNHGDDELCK